MFFGVNVLYIGEPKDHFFKNFWTLVRLKPCNNQLYLLHQSKINISLRWNIQSLMPSNLRN